MPSADGRQILVTAERDGDTVSPERGIYLVSLDARVTVAEVRGAHRCEPRGREGAAREGRADVPARSWPSVKRALAEVSTARIYGYEKALFDFDSKHITKPGNKLAGEYLFDMYRSFGYEPEYQWFEPRGALGGRSANVLATLRAPRTPNSSTSSAATTTRTRRARAPTTTVRRRRRCWKPRACWRSGRMPATIIFASFTGEESGLLGSREFVRRAQESGTCGSSARSTTT